MDLTPEEYQALRTAYLSLLTGQETANVVLPSGKRIEFFQKDIERLENLITGYEMTKGIVAVRTYAKHVRRR
jgi:hypothetical protein